MTGLFLSCLAVALSWRLEMLVLTSAAGRHSESLAQRVRKNNSPKAIVAYNGAKRGNDYAKWTAVLASSSWERDLIRTDRT